MLSRKNSYKLIIILLLTALELQGHNLYIFTKEKPTGILNHFVDVYETEYPLSPEAAIDAIKKKTLTKHENKCSVGFSKNFFWIHFSISNMDSTGNLLYISLENPHIDSTVLYEVSVNGHLNSIGKGGDKMSFNKRQLISRNILFYIEFEPHETKEFLLFIDKRNASVSFPLKVSDKDHFLAHDQFFGLALGVILGALLFIALFSLFLGRVLWQKIFLYYGLYVLFLVAYLFTDSGLSFQFLYPETFILNNYTRVILYKFFSFFLIGFSIQYLNINDYKPGIAKLMYGIYIGETGLQVLVMLLFVRQPHYVQYILNISYISFFLMTSALAYYLISTLRKQPFYNLSYGISVGFVLTAIFLTILLEYGLVQEYRFPFPPMIAAAFAEVSLLSIFLIFRVKNIYTHRISLMQELNEQKKKLMQAFVKGGDQERNFISQELHDNVGVRLILLKNRFSLANKATAETGEIDSIIAEVRQLSHKLSPPTLPLIGFSESIRRLTNEFNETYPVRFELEMFSMPELQQEVSVQLYRVLQEAFKNIILHANATLVEVQLFGYPNQLVVTIDDNGTGLDLRNNTQPTGLGMKSMKSRIGSLNGTFEFSSYPGKGVNILITIPLS